MKISLHWLNAYLDRPVEGDEAEAVLTAQGFPVEERLEAGEDLVFDVEVTSNRGDCLSHVGLAREVAAGTGRALLPPPDTLPPEGAERAAEAVSVERQAPEACPVYSARLIRGLTVAPSPPWLLRAIEAIGLRPVNNVVDVTNYVLHELGQPLHAFDAGRLEGERIVVRWAARGERFEAIDGSAHALEADMLVIADASRPVAVAGIMGGRETEVTGATTDVLLESAAFDPLAIRRTSRALKLASDSSYRFERGIDPRAVERASRRAAELILSVAGGTLAGGVVREGAEPPAPRRVELRAERCNALTGLDLAAETMAGHLAGLGLEPEQEGERLRCTVPSFRLDLEREVDLVEEVVRMHRYENVPVAERVSIQTRPIQPETRARRELGRVLVAHGFYEAVTFGFLPEARGRPFLGAGPVRVDDERRKSEPMLRPSLLPSLLACRKGNQDAGNRDVKLFELGACWQRRAGGTEERRMLALVADVGEAPSHAVRELRTALEALVDRLAGQHAAREVVPAEPHGCWAQVAAYHLNGEPVGAFGLVGAGALGDFGLQRPVVAAELDADRLVADFPPATEAKALPRFPGIERDLSVVVEVSVSWASIESAIRALDPALLERITFLGTYRGKPIPRGRKSVSLRLGFRDPERTLRHEEVDSQVEAVTGRLEAVVGAELRGGSS